LKLAAVIGDLCGTEFLPRNHSGSTDGVLGVGILGANFSTFLDVDV
jgi:hypothetical protein